MLRLALSSFRARKLRFLLTTVAIVLGVGFVSGSYVLSDSILAAFDELFTQTNQGVDVQVRNRDAAPAEQAAGDASGVLSRDPNELRIPESVLEQVRAVPGVKRAVPTTFGAAQIVANGKLVGQAGPPKLGFSWVDDRDLGGVTLVEGDAPSAPGEIVLDVTTAKQARAGVGDEVTVVFDAGRSASEYVVVGLARFGEENEIQGASLSFFDHEEAQRVFRAEGFIDQVSVEADEDVTPVQLRARVRRAIVDPRIDVITGDQATEEQVAAIDDSFLRFIRYGALGFAGISLFVAAFLIFNTFSIIVAQRIREFGLLRALGASRRQVNALIVIESLVVAVAASAVGVVAGLGVAKGITAMFGALDIDLPQGDLTLSLRTVWVSMIVGVGVTFVAAVVPALRAGRISPVEALRAEGVRPPASRWRRVVGFVLSVLLLVGGGALVGVGLFASDTASRALLNMGLGFALLVVGVNLVGPVLVRPVVAVVGLPIRALGTAGQLASRNAVRNRRRTMSTAAALMIGIALVTFAVIFVDSTKESVSRQVDRAIGSDITLSNEAAASGPAFLSPEIADDVAAVEGVQSAIGLRTARFDVAGGGVGALAVEDDRVDEALRLDLEGGTAQALGERDLLVSRTLSDQRGWDVGDTVRAQFVWNDREEILEITGIFADTGFNDAIISDAAYAELYPPNVQLDSLVVVNLDDGANAADVRAAIERELDDRPFVNVEDATDLKARANAQLDVFLGSLFAMLGLAVLIAFFGIVNTLALSVFERTREIGLLRAVGMTRRQVRRMVRGESIIVAVLGGVLGMTIGIGLGWAFVESLRGEGLEVVSVPLGQLAAILLVSAAAGLFAAVLPAYRAGRLEVLDAISYE